MNTTLTDVFEGVTVGDVFAVVVIAVVGVILVQILFEWFKRRVR